MDAPDPTPPPPPEEPAAAAPPEPAEEPSTLRAEEPRPRPLGPVETTLIVVALPILYLFGSLPSYLPSLGTPLGYVVLVDQIFNMAGLGLLGLMAFGFSPRQQLGLQRPPARLVLLVAAFAAANFVVAAVLSSGINDWLFAPEEIRTQSRGLVESLLSVDTPMEKVWLLLAMVVGAPVAEELFFRGFFQNVLSRWWQPGTAVLGTAMVFTLFHFVPLRFALVFEMALVLGILYHRAGSLWLNIVFHAVTNAMAQGFFYASQSASESLDHGAVFIPAAFAWALLGWLLQRELRGVPPPRRDELPTSVRWGWFGLRLAGVWALALIFGLLAIPLAGPNAVALQRKVSFEMQPVTSEIGRRWETDAAWEEFFRIHSAVRAEVKRGKVPVAAYKAWLRSVRDQLRRSLPAGAHLDAKTAEEAEQPLPNERATLDRIRVGAAKRFSVPLAPPPSPPPPRP
jgi:membrane protease YdiL (CAAX protease family)